MKLRIYNNSIRLRLSQTDVARFTDHGSVESAVNFGSGENKRLVYRVCADGDIDEVRAEMAKGEIVVRLPRKESLAWARSDQVSIVGDQNVTGEGSLHILVEKDFTCLSKREGDDDVDSYPHPGANE